MLVIKILIAQYFRVMDMVFVKIENAVNDNFASRSTCDTYIQVLKNNTLLFISIGKHFNDTYSSLLSPLFVM